MDLISTQNVRNFIEDHKWHLVGLTATALGLYALRVTFLSPPKCKSEIQLEGKTVIITGANTGLGRATAIELAKRGARVILACRDLKKGIKAASEIRKESDNMNVIVEELDLSSFESIKEFAKRINENETQVNILINNAGVMACPFSKTKDGYETHFAVNYLGHFVLTNLLLKKLIDSAPSRIINLTSKLYESGRINWDDLNLEENYDPIEAYKQSKLCNLLFTHELANRLDDKDVSVHSVSPGIVMTDLGRHFKSYGYWTIIKMLVFYPLMRYIFRTPTEGAQTTVHCSIDEDAKLKSGKFFRDCKEIQLLPHARDDNDAKKLWSLSEDITRDIIQP